MKDFIKVWVLLLIVFITIVIIGFLGLLGPLVLSIIGIILSVIIISTGIYLSKKRNHNLPKEKQEEYLKKYKDQFKK